jgi:hypothetical protein
LGESIHGYAIAKVEAGEHSGFHFFDAIVVYWGFGIMVVSCAVGYKETLFKWPVMGVSGLGSSRNVIDSCLECIGSICCDGFVCCRYELLVMDLGRSSRLSQAVVVKYMWFHDWCSWFLYQQPRGLTRALVVLLVYAHWSVLTKRLQVGLVGLPWLGYWR